jgi:hypothetical protein
MDTDGTECGPAIIHVTGGDCIEKQELFTSNMRNTEVSSSNEKHWDIRYPQRQYNPDVSQNPRLPSFSRFSFLEKWFYLVVPHKVCEEASSFGLSKLLA